MKNYLCELAIMILVLFVTCAAIYYADTPSDLAKRMKNIDEKLEIINLGTSHGDDFDYSQTSLNGLRANREGNTIYYDLQNYMYLCEQGFLSENAIILLPISYHIFGLGENRPDRLPDDSFVNQFYYYLPEHQIYAYSDKKKNSLILYTIQQNFTNAVKNGAKLILRVDKRKKESSKSLSDTDLNRLAVNRAQHHKRLSRYRDKSINIKYLGTLINEIKENGHRPILIATPFYHRYNQHLGDSWLNQNYYVVMDSLSSAHQVPFLDFSKDKRLSLKPQYFRDSDHLNSNGKKVFSNIVFDTISELY